MHKKWTRRLFLHVSKNTAVAHDNKRTIMEKDRSCIRSTRQSKAFQLYLLDLIEKRKFDDVNVETNTGHRLKVVNIEKPDFRTRKLQVELAYVTNTCDAKGEDSKPRPSVWSLPREFHVGQWCDFFEAGERYHDQWSLSFRKFQGRVEVVHSSADADANGKTNSNSVHAHASSKLVLIPGYYEPKEDDKKYALPDEPDCDYYCRYLSPEDKAPRVPPDAKALSSFVRRYFMPHKEAAIADEVKFDAAINKVAQTLEQEIASARDRLDQERQAGKYPASRYGPRTDVLDHFLRLELQVETLLLQHCLTYLPAFLPPPACDMVFAECIREWMQAHGLPSRCLEAFDAVKSANGTAPTAAWTLLAVPRPVAVAAKTTLRRASISGETAETVHGEESITNMKPRRMSVSE